MSQLVDVLIGDIEGRNKLHVFYLNLENEEYEKNDQGNIVLTSKGIAKYSTMWDTRYYNYSIQEISEEKRKQLIEQNKKLIQQATFDIEILSSKK